MRLRKDEKVELISKVPLFARCSKKELRMIANIADQIEWPEGKTLIKEGRPGNEFFILIDGTVSVSRDGRKLRDLAAGEWVGEIALISRLPRTATVVATSPIRALVLTGGGFFPTRGGRSLNCREDPGSARRTRSVQDALTITSSGNRAPAPRRAKTPYGSGLVTPHALRFSWGVSSTANRMSSTSRCSTEA